MTDERPMEGTARAGLRERKKRETRAALSWAVIRLSVERGWDNVSVDDVAEAVNVSPRTFRNYFASKAEAVVARHLDRMLSMADDLRARPSTEPLNEAIVQAVLGRLSSEHDTAEGWQGPSRDWNAGVRLMINEPDVQGEFFKANAAGEEELARAIAERTGTDVTRDYYPALVAATTGAALTVALDHWLRTEPPVPLAPLLRQVFDRLWAGLEES